MTYQLLGAPVSLYSGKARGYLRWKNVPFTERLATREVYKSEILPRVGWSVIPVVIHEDGSEHGVTLQDTTDIIDYVEQHAPGPSVYPDGPRQRLAALLLELFGDEWLVIPAMHYRWTYNRDFAHGEFGAMQNPDLPPEEQRARAQKAVDFFSGSIRGLGVSDATIPAIEVAYETFLSAFNDHLADQPFLFGSRPSIGDYGLLGPLYAHLLRDPASGEIMRRLAPRVAAWCAYTHAPQHALTGDFLPDDEIPSGTLELLHQFAAQQLPVLLDTVRVFSEWLDAHPDTVELPRYLGFHEVTLGHGDTTAAASRAVFPYPLWMLQRALDHLALLQGEDRAAAEELLRSIKADALIGLTLPARLERRHFQLVRT